MSKNIGRENVQKIMHFQEMRDHVSRLVAAELGSTAQRGRDNMDSISETLSGFVMNDISLEEIARIFEDSIEAMEEVIQQRRDIVSHIHDLMKEKQEVEELSRQLFGDDNGLSV